MSQGLQIWDEDGKVTLDTATDTVKILGVYKGVTDSTVSSDLLITQRFFYIVAPPLRYPDARYNGELLLSVTLNESTCHIKSQDAGITVYIGVY
jgi:hypothetical protein